MNVAEYLNVHCETRAMAPALGFRKEGEWKEINWKTFRSMVFRIATSLRQHGIVKGDRVAIYSNNSAEWICFDLAVMSLGGITVPVYATNTKEQVRYALEDSAAKIVMTGDLPQYRICKELLSELPTLQLVIAAKNSAEFRNESPVYLRDFIEDADEDFVIENMLPDDTATIIYTSGTTGEPKGVMLTHDNFLQAFRAHFDFFRFKNFEREHSLAFLPLAHVFERSWTHLVLHGGAKVSVCPDPKQIADVIKAVKPTMMCAVPRFYQKIYNAIRQTIDQSSPTKKKIFEWALAVGKARADYLRASRAIPLGLKIKSTVAEALVFKKIKQQVGGKLWFMPCGGASITATLTEFFDALGLHLTVGYGLTETTATVTCFPFTQYDYRSVGKPLTGTEIRIGENDEIWVRGPGVMKGYYNKPEANSAAFTADGWLRTGDAGRMDEQGNVYLTERIKDLLKTSNGKYIIPQPIENLLTDDPYILQAMVVAEGRPFVTAFIVPDFELLKKHLPQWNMLFTSWKEIVDRPEIKEFYKRRIDELQQSMAGFEKVKKFVLMSADFQMETGEITPTLKVKRSVILERYSALIDKLYGT